MKVTVKLLNKAIKLLKEHKVEEPYYVKFKKVEDFKLKPDKNGFVAVRPLLPLLRGKL